MDQEKIIITRNKLQFPIWKFNLRNMDQSICLGMITDKNKNNKINVP